MTYDVSKVTPRPWVVAQSDGTTAIVHMDRRFAIASMYEAPSPSATPQANASHLTHCVNHHEAYKALAEAVAEHFEGTDAPLGEQARALLAKVKA